MSGGSKKRSVKTTAVVDLASSSSDDDDTKPGSNPGNISIGLPITVGPKSKPADAVAPSKPQVSMKRRLPVPKERRHPVPMKRRLPVLMSSGVGPSQTQAKVLPTPHLTVLSNRYMNTAINSVVNLLPTTQPIPFATPSIILPPPPFGQTSLPPQNMPSPPLTSVLASASTLTTPYSTTIPLSGTLMSVQRTSAQILREISPVDFTDTILQSGVFNANILPHTDPAYHLISEYITNSQATARFKVNLDTVLKIDQPSSTPIITQTISNPPSPKFTMMLWHGTDPKNVAGILKNGFVCPTTGNQMFGQGVYFADRISKSAQYCGRKANMISMTPKPGDVGYLFLCEVAIGLSYNARVANHTYKAVPTATRSNGSVMTFDSVVCIGENVPDRTLQKEIDGVTWPVGRTVKNTKFPTYTVLYNEYIVYDPEKIRIKFLVKVVFV